MPLYTPPQSLTAPITITQNVVASASASEALLLTGAAHTALTASTEATDVNYNLARTVQFATGAKVIQRAFRIQAPTYAAVGSTNITTAATLAISGAPALGANVSMSAALALWVEAGKVRMDGTVGIGLTSGTSTLDVVQSGLTGAVQPILKTTGGAHLVSASTEYKDIDFGLSRTVTFGTGALTTQRSIVCSPPTLAFSGASTVTNAATLAVTGPPVAGSNATITNTYSFWVQTGRARFDELFSVPTGKTQTTVGAEAAPAALPVSPTGYAEFDVAGTSFVFPYYAKS